MSILPDHSWILADDQQPGSIRQICLACLASAHTVVTGRGVLIEYRALHGTPITTRSMAGLPACNGLAEGSTPPVAAEEAK